MLWIVATVIAAAAQTARNAMQSHLTASLGTLGATQVRFVYGLPFAVVFLALAAALAGVSLPAPTAGFLVYTAGGAFAQIAATALLLKAMQARTFSVATAFSKTEAVQTAIFAVVILGEHLSAARAAAVVIATVGVVITAMKPGTSFHAHSLRSVVYGVASGALFALASIGFRGGILELGDGPFYLRASTTLVWSLGIQALSLGAWMAAVERRALLQSLALWRQSLLAGFFGAFASQFWFLGFSLTPAANVRTLALIEVLFAQVVAQRVLRQHTSAREAVGMALVVSGVALLLLAA
jgi:drug/metabolite transporter (DMT)-like permease